MTRDEYEEVCKKYPDYLNLTGSGTCYIKGAATFGLYEVTDIIYEGCVLDNKVIGKVWYKCYSPDKKKIQEFIKNYKKVKVKLKQINLNKDFE